MFGCGHKRKHHQLVLGVSTPPSADPSEDCFRTRSNWDGRLEESELNPCFFFKSYTQLNLQPKQNPSFSMNVIHSFAMDEKVKHYEKFSPCYKQQQLWFWIYHPWKTTNSTRVTFRHSDSQEINKEAKITGNRFIYSTFIGQKVFVLH